MPYVKPAEGLSIVDPVRRDVLPPEGRHVEASDYWTRRIQDGDVAETDPPPEIEQPDAPA